MEMVRISLLSGEFVDMHASEVEDLAVIKAQLGRADGVVTVRGGKSPDTKGHVMYVPVRSIMAVELYERIKEPAK